MRSLNYDRYISRFVQEMNTMAKKYEMYDTLFACPCGLDYRNVSSANDVVKLALEASMCNEIRVRWGVDFTSINIQNFFRWLRHPMTRKIIRHVNITNTFSKEYLPYGFVGHKSGSNDVMFNVVAVDDSKSVFCVLNANSKDQIFDISRNSLNINGFRGGVIRENQYINEHVKYPLFSITKLMTCIVAADMIKDMNYVVDVISKDIHGGSGVLFKPHDKLTFSDALSAALISSSNTICYSLARICGKKLLNY